MTSLELALLRLPAGAWWAVIFLVLSCFLAAAGMVALRLWCANKSHLVRLAYERPRLVRISQSPNWTGALLVSIGLLLVVFGVLWPSADAHVFAIADRAWRAKRAGVATSDLVRVLRREQAPWVALRDQGPSLLQGTWSPSEAKENAQNAMEAARLVGKARALEVLGFILALFGGLFLLVMA